MTCFLQRRKLAEVPWSLWLLLESGKTSARWKIQIGLKININRYKCTLNRRNNDQIDIEKQKSTKSLTWFWGRPPHPALCHICLQLRSRGEVKCLEPKCYEVLVTEGTPGTKHRGFIKVQLDLTWLNGSPWALAVWSGSHGRSWQAFLALDCTSRPGQAGKESRDVDEIGWSESKEIENSKE